MSWNGNDDKDPWGRKEGPPDIDEAVKQFKKKINLEDYSEGVYIVNIISNTGKLYTKRISYIK